MPHREAGAEADPAPAAPPGFFAASGIAWAVWRLCVFREVADDPHFRALIERRLDLGGKETFSMSSRVT